LFGGKEVATLAAEGIPIEEIRVRAYTIPTEAPESDGTFQWDSTTMILVTARAGGEEGLGYSYASTATARLIQERFTALVAGMNVMNLPAIYQAMVHDLRNIGRPGIDAMAIAAVDSALWDLKARIVGLPLVALLGAAHEEMAIYGSGGFTSYSIEELEDQLGGWAEQGFSMVKMKVGRDPEADVERVEAAREAIGEAVELFVDGNGAYGRKAALAYAGVFADYGVTWFEEPVSSDDLDGLRLLRDEGPAGMEIVAGEYGYDLWYFQRMLNAGAVDVLMPDVTRCNGITGFLQAGHLCDAYQIPLSSHCAPALSLHPCCALSRARHIEYFYDHARIEQIFFDGAPRPFKGALHPDLSQPGLGLTLKANDVEKYAVGF
jgi:L-alanine-DL-glutamate epimerase-like enolase superfamily enzyme